MGEGRRSRRRSDLRLLALAVLAAALVRVHGIHFGYGALTARPDEELIRTAAWHALTGDLNPHYAVWGHLFHYLYVVAGYVLIWSQLLLGESRDWWHAVASALEDGSAHFLLGRLISATAGTATVAAVYGLTKATTRSRLAAHASAWVMAFLFLHVRDSHFATCDVLLTLACTVALWAVARGCGTMTTAFLSAAALAAKLSAAPVVVAASFDSLLSFRQRQEHASSPGTRRGLATYLIMTVLFWAILQPYLWLDLPQTHFGLFRDLFNPERQPMREGIRWQNASIILRYYVPQGIGWMPAIAAAVGLLWFCIRARRRRDRAVRAVVLCYAAVSLGVLLVVRRIFLRYLDPVLPIVALAAGTGIAVIATAIGRRTGGRGTRVAAVAVTVLVVAPEALRAVQLGTLLGRPDTRRLARQWLYQEAKRQGRTLTVYWAGFGQIAAHLTAPWVEAPPAHRERLLEAWRQRGEPQGLLEALSRSTGRHTVALVLWEPSGAAMPPTDSLRAYAGPDVRTELPGPLARWDRWLRQAGVLRPFQPRLFVVRLAAVARCAGPATTVLQGSDPPADLVVVTGMPYDEQGRRLAEELSRRYELAAQFTPGPDAARATYDMGDAWWVPNQGLNHVANPGPEIWIFRVRREVPAR